MLDTGAPLFAITGIVSRIFQKLYQENFCVSCKVTALLMSKTKGN